VDLEQASEETSDCSLALAWTVGMEAEFRCGGRLYTWCELGQVRGGIERYGGFASGGLKLDVALGRSLERKRLLKKCEARKMRRG